MAIQERVAYFNGNIVAESEVLIPFRDRGFLLGDGVFDTARTFGGKVFKLREHIDRLYKSLNYVAIVPGLTAEDFLQISEDVLAQNLPLLGPDEDYWLTQRVTRGANIVGGELWQSSGPTVIVECTPLPLKARAPLFRDGIDVFIPSLRKVPPESLSPNAKTHNYLNLVLADLEIRDRSSHAWAILQDNRGFLTEGIGSNLFLVRDGVLLTPHAQYVLAGISRQTVIELATDLGIPVEETDLSIYDGVNADEAFITSTSFCLCPVRSIDGRAIGNGKVPGPITKTITDAFVELAGFDFVGQYLKHLN